MKSESNMQIISSMIVFVIACSFAAISPVQAQNQQGFISLDCGLVPKDFTYTEKTTNITYISDASFIGSGESKQLNSGIRATFQQQMWFLRSFSNGLRNCYNFNLTKGDKYLIKASFLYGNYDDQNLFPTFDLYIGPNRWTTVNIRYVNISVSHELVHVLSSDHLQICLGKRGLTTPFISALELRPLRNDTYVTQRGSLMKTLRFYFSTATDPIRFDEDAHDRAWFSFFSNLFINTSEWTTVSTNLPVSPGNDSYDVPQMVLRSAAMPKIVNDSITLTWSDKDQDAEYYVFLHFAEIEILRANELREFKISANEGDPSEPYSPPNFTASSKYTTIGLTSKNGSFYVTLKRTKRSTHPPILNGFETYKIIEFLQLETEKNDVDAITVIGEMYGLERVSWTGDPCAPRIYMWDGLNCALKDFDSPRITSLNLSSSQLKGEIIPYIFNLSQLTSLDLSNNNLTGKVPAFLANMKHLSFVDLSANKLNGSVPQALLDRQNDGLTLILDHYLIPCKQGSCKSKSGKNNAIVPIVASVASVAIVLGALGFFFMLRRKRHRYLGDTGANSLHEPSKLSKERQFTYTEVVKMTNNFNRILGRGGFGVVYHGYHDGTEQVAVKILSPSSAQGNKQFRTEVELLLRVHHKNLVSLVGYCEEGDKLALIYEYMANGDLKGHLSGHLGSSFLSWSTRLRIATETAQGLEYLHNGCKPPMIHRDIKTNNILLNEDFQAKLADFGLSRSFPMGKESHVSTVVAGTPGYLDPEYYMTNWLTEKSDIYSFGIVLLEIITNQPVIDSSRERPYIAEWGKFMVYEADIENIIDPTLRGNYDVNTVWKATELAFSCLNQSPSKRPNISHVVTTLSECLAAENTRAQLKITNAGESGSIY